MKRTFVCRGRYLSRQRYTVTFDQHLDFETMLFFLLVNHRESLNQPPERWAGEQSEHRADLDAPERRR